MMAFIEENNLKKTALNYAFDYSEKIAEAKFATPSEFIAVAEMFYEFLRSKDDRK